MRAHGLEVAPEHGRDQVQLVDLAHPARHHRAAVAHDRDPVADLVEFVEPVTDEDDSHALGAQAAHHVEQNRDLAEDILRSITDANGGFATWNKLAEEYHRRAVPPGDEPKAKNTRRSQLIRWADKAQKTGRIQMIDGRIWWTV